jgi:ferredoxin
LIDILALAEGCAAPGSPLEGRVPRAHTFTRKAHVPILYLLGRVFDIQRFSLDDGPGIRTTVFLKGCPLRCLWCHNPEGMSASQAISFLPEKCMACGECVRACPSGAHRLEASEENGSKVTHVYDREVCEACGRCTKSCDAGALEFVGRLMTVEEVMKEVNQDRAFYATSGGGMTIPAENPGPDRLHRRLAPRRPGTGVPSLC